jgi:hypothetical protein
VIGRRPEPRDLFAVYPSRALVPVRVRAALAWVIAHGKAAARKADMAPPELEQLELDVARRHQPRRSGRG